MTPRAAGACSLGVLFTVGGLAKLTGRGPAKSLGRRLGLSPWLLGFIGSCELAGGLGLLVGEAVDSRLGAAAGLGLTALTASGALAHVRAGEGAAETAPAVVLGLASLALARAFVPRPRVA